MVPHPEEPTVPLLWELQLSTRLGIPPIVLGALLSVALIAALLGFHWAFGLPVLDPEAVFSLHEGPRLYVFCAVLLGYVLGACGYEVACTEKDLRTLSLLDPNEASALRIPKNIATRSRFAGAAGGILAFFFIEVVQRGIGSANSTLDMLRTWEFSPGVVLLLVTGWILGRAVYMAVQRTALHDSIDGPVDLLDLQAFRVLGKSALRTSLVFILGISLMTPWIFVPGFSGVFVPFTAIALVIPTLLLLVPVRGAARKIRDAKRAELTHLASDIRTVHRDAARGNTAAQARMSFLLSYRSHIDGIREWPFETSSMTRFGLYLLIPVGSWLASALVERFVNAVLD